MSSSFPSSSSLSIPSSSNPGGSHILAFPHSPSTPVNQVFTRKELVGKGAYGGVYKGIHNPTGTVVALKVIDLDTPDDDISEIQKEVALLSELRDAARHNITLYHGCYLQGYELWIAMDFASGGSIRTLMKSGPIEEKYAALIVREVLVALSFLHRQDIIHRDVKAANILLTQTGKILLCDFGVAAHLQANSKRSTFTGTPLWMAPEVITDGKLYDTKADVWSLGITLYEIIVGNPPHFGMEPLRACAIIPRSQPPTFPEGFEGLTSGPMREFLASCLMVDPTNRPTADELSRTKWIKSASKLPMVLLRELIVRYVSWIQSGGQRTSIVGTLPGMEGGGDLVQREDTFELAGEREEGWDFDVEEEDFGITLGLGRSEGLGDEPSYGGAGKVTTLDELAAKGNLRPPKQPQPSRNHPLLRLFDEESNPYAQPNLASSTTANSSSSSTANPLISLPTSSLNTLKPTISLPSFDDLDTNANDDGPGISLPSFDVGSSAFGGGGGFGSSSGGAGWGGAGWGSVTNDPFGGSPFDTIGAGHGSSGRNSFGEVVTPATVRSNPFNDRQSSGTSWDQRRGAVDGFGEMANDSSPFGESEFGQDGGHSEDTWGKNRTGPFGGSGNANGFKFGGPASSSAMASSSSTPTEATFSSTDLALPPVSSSSQGFSNTPAFPPSTSSTLNDQDTVQVGVPKAPFGGQLANRRRADTAPSSRPPPSDSLTSDAGEPPGGYPPLGPGLPRTSSNAGGSAGGYPPLGAGLPRSNVNSPNEAGTNGESGTEPLEGMNRPFGGGAARPFQFGGSLQRERAATMLNSTGSGESNRPFRFGGAAGLGDGGSGLGDRKRAGSDGRRQGLSIMTSIPQQSLPSTMITSPSPSSTSIAPKLHKRQASSLSTHSYTASSSSPSPSPTNEKPPTLSRHRANQLSTSSATSSTSTLLLTASPTSSLSLSAGASSPANSFISLPPPPDPTTAIAELDQPTPLAHPPAPPRAVPATSEDLATTAIGFPFPPVGDLLVPPSSSQSTTPLNAPPPLTAPPPLAYSSQLPVVKALDYARLVDSESVGLELQEVLKGLESWFNVVKNGLDQALNDDGRSFIEDVEEEEENQAPGEEDGMEEWIAGLDLRESSSSIEVR